MFLFRVSHEIMSSCGTELQSSKGSAGAEEFASRLTHVVVGIGGMSLPQSPLPGATCDVASPRVSNPTDWEDPRQSIII